jgi:hypothetical protein
MRHFVEKRQYVRSPVTTSNCVQVVGGCLLGCSAVYNGMSLPAFQRSVRRYNPEDSQLHSHRRENLKSYVFIFFSAKAPR